MIFEKAEPRSHLNHPKNIVRGGAVVIYVPASGIYPAGWVLPGGRRTMNEFDAEHCASVMNQIMLGNARAEPVEVTRTDAAHHPV